MDEKKTLKKAYKKQKRRLVTLWKTLTIFLLVFALILTPLSTWGGGESVPLVSFDFE